MKKIKIKNENENKIPHYCCGRCKTAEEAYKNLKVINNTGWTHDICCLKLHKTVYGM